MANAKKKKKSFKGLIITLVVIGGIVAGVLYLSGKAAENASKNITIPDEIVVEAGSISRTVDGGGTLDPEETFDIKIPSGVTILETDFAVGDIIHAGDVIATLDVESINSCIVTVDSELNNIKEALKDTHDMTEYQIEEYESRQTILEGQRERLLALYDDPYIVCESDGIIMSLSEAAAATSSINYRDVVTSMFGVLATPFKRADEPTAPGSDESQTTPETSDETTTGTEAPTDATVSSEPSDTAAPSVSDSTEPSQSSESTPESSSPATTPSAAAPSETEPAPAVITDFTYVGLVAPVRGEAPRREITENIYYEGAIAWGVGTDEFEGETFAPSTSYTALVMLTPKDGYTFSNDVLPQVEGAVFSQGAVDPVSKTLTIVAMFPATEADPDAPASAAPTGAIPGLTDPSGLPEDISSLLEGVDLQQYLQQYIASQAASATSGLDMSSLLGLSGADYSSFASGLSAASSRPAAASSDVTIATVAKTETVKITILVDELDILLVHVGQEADIEIDAVDERFTGTISRVSNIADSGLSSSGINLGTTNARYQIDISIPMDENMRLGMSATATITVSSVEDVPVIPMSALQQRGDELFVYGGYDESGTLVNEIPVTTGISDGVNVEITSGVNIGDTIYGESTGSDGLMDLLM